MKKNGIIFLKTILSRFSYISILELDIQTRESMEQNQKDFNWIAENYDDLKKDYGDKYIAVFKNDIIANDYDYNNLLKKLKEMNKEIFSTSIIKFISTKDYPLTI
jgi:hypothetical protein